MRKIKELTKNENKPIRERKIKESQSLINLKYYLQNNLTRNTKGVHAKTIKVKPIKDVLEYIKISDFIEWKIIGHDKKNKPIYDNYITIHEWIKTPQKAQEE